jgi:hypothetical protein
VRSGGEIVCSAGVLWFQEKHTQLTDDPHSRQAGAVSVVSARNSFAAHGSSVPQKRSRRRTPSSVGVDLHTRRGRAPPAAGLRSPLWRSGPVASSEGPVLNCEGPPFARPGDSATRPVMWCMCGPKGATGDGNTEADRLIVRTHATPRVFPSTRAKSSLRAPGAHAASATIRFRPRPAAIHGVPTPADRLHRPPSSPVHAQRMDRSARSLVLNDQRLIVYGACPRSLPPPRSRRPKRVFHSVRLSSRNLCRPRVRAAARVAPTLARGSP